jgi:hypothetical protein
MELVAPQCCVVQHRCSLGFRAIHTFPSTQDYQPLPYCNWRQLRAYYISKRDWDRTILLANLPPFANQGDTMQLLDESGFSPDLILVRYRGGNGNLHRTYAAVVLSTAEQASRALKELQDAPLFDKKITCLAYEPEKPSTEPDLTWGWYATSHPGFGHVRHRAPLLSPPTNA